MILVMFGMTGQIICQHIVGRVTEGGQQWQPQQSHDQMSAFRRFIVLSKNILAIFSKYSV